MIDTEILRTATRLYSTWRDIVLETQHPSCLGGMDGVKSSLEDTAWRDLSSDQQLVWLGLAESMFDSHSIEGEVCVCGKPSPCESAVTRSILNSRPFPHGFGV